MNVTVTIDKIDKFRGCGAEFFEATLTYGAINKPPKQTIGFALAHHTAIRHFQILRYPPRDQTSL